MPDILRDRLSKVVEKINQPKEPVKYVLHVAEASTLCFTALEFGNIRLKEYALYGIYEVCNIVIDNLSPNRSVEISKHMTKDVGETLALEVAKQAGEGLVACGCGKTITFKLVEVDGD